MTPGSLAEAREEINLPLWIIGWHGRYFIPAFTLVIGAIGWFGIGENMGIVLGSLAFFISPIIWYLGVREINGNYKMVLNGFEYELGDKIEKMQSLEDDGEDFEAYGLRSGSGSKFLRKPKKKYEMNSLLLTDYSATLHDEADLNMVWLDSDIGRSTQELYFDSISNVNYVPPEGTNDVGEFYINMNDGRGHSWPSDREPKDALDAVNRRVREYKRNQAN